MRVGEVEEFGYGGIITEESGVVGGGRRGERAMQVKKG